MLLDLSEIVMREGMRVDLDIDQAGVEDPDLVFARPLTGQLHFENSVELISITGKSETTLTIPCSRCLVDVAVPIGLQIQEHLPVDDVMHPNREPVEGAEIETVVSTIVYLDQGRPILDLDELLRQLIVTEVPIKTLCDEDCKGLCPQCGVNRNETPCDCAEQQRNTPLAVLGALLGNGAAGGEKG